MLNKGFFKKPNLPLEVSPGTVPSAAPGVPERMMTACPGCKKSHFSDLLDESLSVCPDCGHHFRVSARTRIEWLCDSFHERDSALTSRNILDFPDYDRKLAHARKVSGEREAVITGVGDISGSPCALFAMEPGFMMGSMGSVVGEKVTRLFELARELRLPVVGCTVSGGARMQEGMVSLLQMAKVSGAVKRHSDAGLLYITILTDPTTGGVTASFAMEGDIILAEPQALVGFAGPRVIEQTTRVKLPAGFQRAEFLLDKGFVDAIVDRRALKDYIANLLEMHRGATS